MRTAFSRLVVAVILFQGGMAVVTVSNAVKGRKDMFAIEGHGLHGLLSGRDLF